MSTSKFLKKLTAAEVGKTNTHEVYIRIPNDFDYESFFNNTHQENGSVIEVNFAVNAKSDIYPEIQPKVYNLRLVHYINNANKEKRIPGISQLLRDFKVDEGDVVCLERIEKDNTLSFNLTFLSPDTIRLYNGALLLNGDIDTTKVENTSIYSDQPLQLIYYGAPGTGKSFTIDQVTNENNSVRTTFHPDSDYASFVGAYKPTMVPMPINAFVGTTVHHAKNSENKEAYEKKIVYKYVPQAFLKAYVEAWKRYAAGEDDSYYLVIEEINRGNCAQIFGDLFQLLDRNNMGCSSYAISADEDIVQFLREDDKGFGKLTEGQKEAISKFRLKKDSGVEEHIGPEILNGSKLLLPPNLRIWATMNTSDQSLFPIDSAFKRRWNWEYMPIEYDPTDKNTGERLAWKFEVRGKRYYWGKFLDYINPKILKLTMSEDKQMGYFFAKPDKRGTDGRLDVISEKVFVNKVLFYLWTDVFKDYDLTEKPFVYETTTAEGKSIKKSYRFTDFFPIEGNQKLIDFVRGMGLKVEDDGEQTPEQPSDENPTNIGNYVVNGTPVRFQNAVGAEAIKAYMSIYPEKTANEVVEDWKGLGQIVSYFVQTEAEHQARTDSRKDYVITIDCKGENIYVSKEGWGDNRPNGSIYALLNMVNAIKQKGWPIEIKGVE